MRPGIVIAILALQGAPLFAQDKPLIPPFLRRDAQPGAQDDPKAEMQALFKKVESRLDEIDKLLYGAGAGDTRLAEVKESGIAGLLDQSQARSDEVLKGIDRILEIARENSDSSDGSGGSCRSLMKKPGGGQGQQSGPPPSAEGSPKQGAKEPQQREQTPEGPGKEPKGGKQPDSKGQQDDPNGQEPRGNKESPDEGRNRPGGPPPKLATDTVDGARVDERWGELPQQVRDLFRTEGGGGMPPQYRDWIDAYYRRLNQPVR